MARTIWTQQEIADLVANHERVLSLWTYPEDVCKELRRARQKWIEGVRISS